MYPFFHIYLSYNPERAARQVQVPELIVHCHLLLIKKYFLAKNNFWSQFLSWGEQSLGPSPKGPNPMGPKTLGPNTNGPVYTWASVPKGPRYKWASEPKGPR